MVKFAGDVPNLPEWFVHGKDIDLTVEQIQELFDTGNNVMMTHNEPDNYLWVDSKMFRQR